MFATVGRHAEAPELPAGPLQRYKTAFPDRYVRWEPKRGLWEVRENNPRTGRDERVEFVFWWDVPGEDESRVADLVETGDPRVTKAYRPFDHRFVGDRLREKREFERWGPKHYSAKTVGARNEARAARLRRHLKSEMAAGLSEIRRYLPTLVGDEKIPQIPVGVDISTPPQGDST